MLVLQNLYLCNYYHNLSDKLKGNHIHSTTNIPLPVVSSNRSLSPLAHTGCNFSKNPGLSSTDSSSKHNQLRKYSNVDIEGMKSRPHSLGMETTPCEKSLLGQNHDRKRNSFLEAGNFTSSKEVEKAQTNSGTTKPFSKKSTSSLPANDDGKAMHQADAKLNKFSKRDEARSDAISMGPDHVVKTTKLEKVPSKSIDNKSFHNTSSSESGSFNATDYKGERTYF